MKTLAILGSTGSIGTQTLDIVRSFPERFRVGALAAGRNVSLLAEQVREFRPACVAVADADGARELREALGVEGAGLSLASGAEGLEAAAVHEADLVVSGLVGAVGLEPTLAAIRAGRDVALANKEVLVMAGALVMREVARAGVTLLPVDSEHSAIFQVLAGQRREDAARIVLTASGGPFRTWPAARIAGARVGEALAHPNWAMGPKISIDSASLMNKGLEVIEARWLFDCAPDEVDVVVHPESIVHSLVEFRDGSVLAQLGVPDMHAPIALALTWPERLALALPRLDLSELAALHFEAPDHDRFPCLGLAFAALRGSEAAPAVLNAANEVAVAAFLAGRVPFPGIAVTNGVVLDGFLAGSGQDPLRDLADAREADQLGRIRAEEALSSVAIANGAGA